MDTTTARFLSKVQIAGPDECWLFLGRAHGRRGCYYGQFDVGRGVITAHRFAWMLWKGAIPPGMCVLHNCPEGDNPMCCNPNHLWLGTQADNHADMVTKGRHTHGEKHQQAIAAVARRGSDHRSAKLKEEVVLQMRQEYADGLATREELSERFGVSRPVVSLLLRSKIWSHVPNPAIEKVAGEKGKAHGKNRGEGNNFSRLTAERVREIRRLYKEETVSQQQLAEQFGVTQSNINMIVLHKTWKHV